MPKSGELTSEITIQKYIVTGEGARGQPIQVWSTRANVRARVEDLEGRKLELARQLFPTATHRITIRYLPDINIKDRVLIGTRVLGIGGITDRDEAHFTQVLYCQEAKPYEA